MSKGRKMWCPNCAEVVVPDRNQECKCGSSCEPTLEEHQAIARAEGRKEALAEVVRSLKAAARDAADEGEFHALEFAIKLVRSLKARPG